MNNRPNLLLILTDHWRGDCLGRLGHPVVETPHLDGLSAQGVTFTHAYTPSPTCVPARRSLMTGMTPNSAGMVGYADGKPWEYSHTLAGELAKSGYQTMNVGKTHFYPERLRLGFHELVTREEYDEWIDAETSTPRAKVAHGVTHNSWFARPSHLPEHQMEETWLVSRAIELLERRDPTLPFFLCLSLSGPHPPWCPPQAYFDMFIDRDMPEPVVGDWAERHDVQAAKPLTVGAWRGRVPDRLSQPTRAAYFAYLAYVDAQIGRLFDYMRALVDDNCMVVFTSDHGEMLGDHNLWRKSYAYEASARVPLIVRPPIDQGSFASIRRDTSNLETVDWLTSPHNVELEHVVGLEDIMPTLLDAAGAAIPDTVEGRSVMPLVRGEEPPWRDYYHLEHAPCYHPENAHQSLTDGMWKYIWNPITGDEQLFNLGEDPSECRDLAAQPGHGSETAAWRRRLAKHLENRPEGLSDGDSLTPGRVTAWRGN